MMKKYLKNTIYRAEDFLYKNNHRIDWVRENNFGDILNPVLAQYITSKKILHVNPLYYNKKYISAIGSICGRANKNAIIWGSGFISEHTEIREAPYKICAVRGIKTAEKYLSLGIEPPAVFGDPALLISRYYKPKIEKKYKIGVIPHYVDYSTSFIKKCIASSGVKVINLINSNPLTVIDEIMQCEIILSSSLHGLIVPEAYGIKTKWIKLSENVIGGDFKFQDHYQTLGLINEEAIRVNDSDDVFSLSKYAFKKDININLDFLLKSSPFYEK
ncbi:polysaccharide pyruvyl transferase family protein [Pseudoalteromonas sp. T1lg10]|uniref:polysaccharide pyruvyl transferase family protein n=1 Tax=Pseudoalteromonas sp. T1lg10 TaxID=2077093 RepID=UPI001319E655|nr:polysaccharide pyruvyl transferase family protein [Pseudoalteromonas sp. T1lg10]